MFRNKTGNRKSFIYNSLSRSELVVTVLCQRVYLPFRNLALELQTIGDSALSVCPQTQSTPIFSFFSFIVRITWIELVLVCPFDQGYHWCYVLYGHEVVVWFYTYIQSPLLNFVRSRLSTLFELFRSVRRRRKCRPRRSRPSGRSPGSK